MKNQRTKNYLRTAFLLLFLVMLSTSAMAYSDDDTGIIDNIEMFLPMDVDANDDVNSYDGTVTNAVLTTSDGGYIDEAYTFDGSGDYITLASPSAIQSIVAGNFTFATWFNADSLSNNKVIFSSGDGSSTAQIIVDFAQSGGDGFRIYDGTGWKFDDTTDYLTTDTWYHVAITHNTQNEELKLYVNGVLVREAQSASSFSTTSTPVVYLGRRHDGIADYDGEIDEASLFSSDLSPHQVYELYTRQLQDSEQHPFTSTSWNPFDDAYIVYKMDTDLTDTAGNADGTANGDAAITTSDGGFIDEGYEFDGTGDYISNSYTDTQNEFTASIWVYEDQTPSSAGHHYELWSQLEDSDGGYSLEHRSTDVLQFSVHTGSWNDYATTKTFDFTDGWHHVVVTREAGYCFLYVDGILERQSTCPEPSSDHASAGNTHYLGIAYDGSSYPYDGKMDEFSYYQRGMSGAEVQDLYNLQRHFFDQYPLEEKLPDDLIYDARHYWKMEDLTNEFRPSTLTANGDATTTTGLIDNGYTFDGTGDYLNTDGFPLNTGNDFAFNIWAKSSSSTNPGGFEALAGVQQNSGANIFRVLFTSDGYIDAKYRGNNGGELTAVGTTDYYDGTWHMFTINFDDNNKRICVYVDGSASAEACAANAASDDWAITKDLYIGAFNDKDVLSSPYTGDIDEVGVWDRQLSPEERSELYASGSPGSNQQAPFGSQEPDNSAPAFDNFAISNPKPIYTNDVIDVTFNVTDADWDVLNISLTWFVSTDNATWMSHSSDDESWLNQGNATWNGTTYNTGSTGDLEAADTTAWEFWYAEGTVTDGIATTKMNTSTFVIANDPPTIAEFGSGTTNENPVNVGESITFEINGSDVQEDDVTMKVCSNEGATWGSCTLLCQQTTPVTFPSASNATITCDYTTVETSRINVGYAILNDTGNVTSPVNITYYVNQFPVLANLTHIDTTGNMDYFFGEYLDYIRVDQDDSYDNSTLATNITLTDPDSLIVLNNVQMSSISGNTKGYETDIFLNAIGTWTVNITTVDGDGALTSIQDTFSVQSTNITTLGRIYAHDYETLPAYSNISDDFDTYDYSSVELRIDTDQNWASFLNILGQMKNASQSAIITLDDDLSNVTNTVSFIESNYGDLTGGDYLNGVLMLKLRVAGVIENSTNSVLINNITKSMFQTTNNRFAIQIRDYNHTDINSNYAAYNSHVYIDPASSSDFVQKEMGYLRNNTATSRIYSTLNASAKAQALSWQNNIISKMRSSLQVPAYYNETNIAELSNGDIIVGNFNATNQTYGVVLDGNVVGYDVYNLNTKKVLENNNDGNVDVPVAATSGVMVYFANLSSIRVEDDEDKILYGLSNRQFNTTTAWDLDSSNAYQFKTGASSANPEDARVILLDPDFKHAGFYVWYGEANSEAITDWSRYSKVIIGTGNEDETGWVTGIANVTEVYGYTAVSDYGVNNNPAGCTPGVDCSTWNRTYWIEQKEEQINNWTDIQSNVNVFVDGLDIGEINDIDGQFGDGLTYLADYVKNSKDRFLIYNTYTSYEDYAGLADFTMRESACARWDGTAQSPTYSYENITLDVERAQFHNARGSTVLAQTFGNITDYEKSYYCYMQNNVLYDNVLYGYNQPTFEHTNATDDFQWNYFKYPELGAALEDDFTVIGNDSYRRRFENGIVTVNSTSRTVDYIENVQIESIEMCSYYYDNDDGAADEGFMNFHFNDNLTSKRFEVSDTDLTAFVKTWKCQNISASYYEPSGFYEMEFWYVDGDGNYLNNNGLFMYSGTSNGGDRQSFYEDDPAIGGVQGINNNHPSQDETDYTAYPTGNNWAINFTINKVSTETSLDDVSSAIDRSTSGAEKVSVTFDSTADWDIPVYDRAQFLNKTRFNGVYVGDTLLNINNNSCNVASPTYSDTVILGETFTYTQNSLECAGAWSTCEGWTNSGGSPITWWTTDGTYSIYLDDSGDYIEKTWQYPANITFDMWVQVGGAELNLSVNGTVIETFNTNGNNKFSNLTIAADQTVRFTGNGILLDNIRVYTQDANETWKACYYEGDSGYYAKVVIPHLSEQTYVIDGNTPPTVGNESISLTSFASGNQSWQFTYNFTDIDGNNISTCRVSVDGSLYTASGDNENNTCTVSINHLLNGTAFTANVAALDEYNDSSTDGQNFTLATITYDGIASSPTTSNFTTQYFRKYWNITQNYGAFPSIVWAYDDLDARTINISNGTTRDYLDFSTNLITTTGFDFTPDGGNEYVVNQGEEMFRYFNITANLSTEEDVPPFNLSMEMLQYISGSQSMGYGASYDPFSNFTSGSNFIAHIGDVSNGSTELYQYVYQGKVIYSDSTLNYTQDGSTRTYFYSNEDGSGYGRKIKFLFASLNNSDIDLTESLDYSELENWEARTSTSQDVFRFTQPSTYVEETNGVDYTYTDNDVSDIVSFAWSPTNSPFTNLFINLSYTADVSVPQCNDGVDNDGDGDIDFPADAGCSSTSDDSENTEGSGGDTGGGGGGGGGDSGSEGTTPVDLGKVVCDLTLVPSQITITDDSPLVQLTLTNREDVSYTPDVAFRDVSGKATVLDHVELSNEIGTVLSDNERQFGVRYKGGLFGTSPAFGGAELVLSNSRCRDVVIPVNMNVTGSSPLAELFEGDEPIVQRVIRILNSNVSETESAPDWAKVWMLVAVLSVLFAAILWNQNWSETPAVNWTVKGIAWLMMVLISTGLIVLFIRGIVGG